MNLNNPGLSKGVFKCPSFMGLDPSYRSREGGYGWNELIGYYYGHSAWPPIKLQQIVDPSRTLVLGDSTDPLAHPSYWTRLLASLDAKFTQYNAGRRHNNAGANMLWVDGHSSYMLNNALMNGANNWGYYFYVPKYPGYKE
jgi:prepilin-type processing-associated H-X9-DG protein